VDVIIDAMERQHLLRDVLEVFAKEKLNVTAMSLQPSKQSKGANSWISLTVEVSDSGRLSKVLQAVTQVSGVRSARRR